MPKIRKDVLNMKYFPDVLNMKYFPDEFNMIGKQMSKHVALMNAAIRRVGTSSNKNSDGFQSFLNSVDAVKELERFKDLTETEQLRGNKRNGTQDRRQAFGGLF